MDIVRSSPACIARIVVHPVLLDGKPEQEIEVVILRERFPAGQDIFVQQHQVAGNRSAAVRLVVPVHLFGHKHVQVVLYIVDRQARFQCQSVDNLIRQVERGAQLVAVVLLFSLFITPGEFVEKRRTGPRQHCRRKEKIGQGGESGLRLIKCVHPLFRTAVIDISQIEAEIAVQVLIGLESQIRKGGKTLVSGTPQRPFLVVKAQPHGIGH